MTTKLFKVSEENILFSAGKIPRKVYLKNLYNFQWDHLALIRANTIKLLTISFSSANTIRLFRIVCFPFLLQS